MTHNWYRFYLFIR